MKRMLSMIAVSIFAFDALGAPMPEETSREAELRDAVHTFGQAFLEADVPTLRGLLTEDYVHVNGGSGNVLGRGEWLDWVKARRAQIEREELRITEYRIEDLSIVSHGNTAIVVGTVFSRQVSGGESSTSRIRFSNTWLYQKGKWRRAAFHDSPLA